MNISEKFNYSMLVRNPSVRLQVCNDVEVFDYSHINVMKDTHFPFAVKFFTVLNDVFKKYKKEFGLNAFCLDIGLMNKDKTEFHLKGEKIKHNIIQVGFRLKREGETGEPKVFEIVTEIYKKIVDEKKKSINGDKIRSFFFFRDTSLLDLTEKEAYLLQVNMLKETIDIFLEKENINTAENWESFIPYCSFLQTMNYTSSLMSDAIYHLILDKDFVNKNYAYKSTVFRSLKYCNSSVLPYLKESEVRKLGSILKIIEQRGKDTTKFNKSYLFNGFISQIILNEGYCGNILNEDLIELTKIIIDSESYVKDDGAELDSPFDLNKITLISQSLINSKNGKYVENITNSKIERDTFLKIELDTNKFYNTLGLKNNNVFKMMLDQIFFLVLDQSNYKENIINLFENNNLNEIISKNGLTDNTGYLHNYLCIKIHEKDYSNIGSIKKYIDDLLEETSKVINNIYAERWFDFSEKEKNMPSENYDEKIKKILTQTQLLIKNEKAREIIAHLRKNELMNRLDMIGKEADKIKKKL